jgi:hypothetical protein
MPEVREHEHSSRVFDESIRQLVEAEPNVLQADFISDNLQWQRRESLLQRAQGMTDNSSVTHSGRGKLSVPADCSQVLQFERGTPGHLPPSITGIDACRIFVAIIVESKRTIGGCWHRLG